MSETVIQVSSLGKRIKGKTILEDISFEINQGECVALIGPNGAGKTVLMSCILGDKKPSSGQVLIEGKAGKAKNQIAVLLQENTIPNSLKVSELIAFFQAISDNPLTIKNFKTFCDLRKTSTSSLRTNSQVGKDVFWLLSFV